MAGRTAAGYARRSSRVGSTSRTWIRATRERTTSDAIPKQMYAISDATGGAGHAERAG
jgi:hypothetical protein